MEEERPPLAGPVYRVGWGVSPPRLKRKVEPAYTPEARAALVQGDVDLYVVVTADGYARNVRVLKSLDPGLDRKAIECVKQWQFEPGVKDGEPVNVETNIQVNFRLGAPIQR